MRLVLLAAALALAAPGSSSAQDPTERDLRQALGYAQRGVSALEKGNTTKAREAFGRAMAKVPDLPEAHIGLGHIAMRERRFDDALVEYRLAQSSSQQIALIRLRLEQERFVASRDQLQRLRGMLAQLQTQTRREQVGIGSGAPSSVSTSDGTRISRAQIETQIRNLESMNPPTPQRMSEPSPDMLFFEGNALFNLKRTPEAIPVWEDAVRRDPRFAPLHNNLAVAYWMVGRLEEARASVARAEDLGFQVNPNFRADLEKAAESSSASKR